MKKRKIKNIQKRRPVISVVLPVFNSKEYLVDALESLLKQTYQNFEIIAVDDGSSDGSYKILLQYARKYKKIRVFRNKYNKGVSETAKKAIQYARGDYLARMDADDICLPNRLEKQLSYLKKHTKTVAVGGQCLIIDEKNKIIGKKTFPTDFESIYKYLFQFVAVQQPTFMIARRRLPNNFVYYVDGMNTAEEVELFFKLFTYGRVENLPDVVLLYRHHENNTSLLNVKRTFLLTLIARIKAVYRYNYKPSAKGIIVTLLQAILIFLLPRSAIMILYKFFREASMDKAPTLIRYNTLSPRSLLLNTK